jgi:hypothetical protein
MLKQAARLLAVVVVFFGCFLMIEMEASPFFQSCVSQNAGDESNQSSKKGNSSIGSVILVYARCSGRFLDGYGSGITGLFTIILAASTILLWIVTNKAASAAQAAAEHIPTVERAYVRLSNCEPGIMFSPRGCDVRIEIKAIGSTPARVTNVVLNFRILPRDALPRHPPYNIPDREPIRAFLLPNEPIFITEESEVSLDEVRDLPSEMALYVFGYVDYIDVFHKRHRGGYGRIYIRGGSPSNLGVITNDGYNYDCPRVRGEGNDWDQS